MSYTPTELQAISASAVTTFPQDIVDGYQAPMLAAASRGLYSINVPYITDLTLRTNVRALLIDFDVTDNGTDSTTIGWEVAP